VPAARIPATGGQPGGEQISGGLTQVREPRQQPGPAARAPALDGALGDAEQLGHLGHRVLEHVDKHERDLLIARQLPERLRHLHRHLGPGGRIRADVHVIGTDGQMTVQNFIHPHLGYRMTTSTAHHTESVISEPGQPAESTYLGQLRAFAGAVLRGERFPTTAEHATVTMELIDDIYRAAGLPLRPAGM